MPTITTTHPPEPAAAASAALPGLGFTDRIALRIAVATFERISTNADRGHRRAAFELATDLERRAIRIERIALLSPQRR